MTRLVRRPPRVLPRRGRSSPIPPENQPRPTPLTVFRQGRPSTGPRREKIIYRETVVERPDPREIHPVLIQLYRLAPYLFTTLNRPWKWLVALALMLILAIALGTLL